MDAAASHIETLLQTAADASDADHALAFSVFLPCMTRDGVSGGECHKVLASSRFLRRTFTIAAADHGYCDGAAHQRSEPFRQSPYDVACYLLQTDKAARKWPTSDEVEGDLRRAMAEAIPVGGSAKQRKRPRENGKGHSAKRTNTTEGDGGEDSVSESEPEME